MLWNGSVTGCQGSMVASSLALRRIGQQQTGLIAGSLFFDPSSIFRNFVDPCNYRQRSFCVGLYTCLYMLAKVDIFCLPFPHVCFLFHLIFWCSYAILSSFWCASYLQTLDVSCRSFTIGLRLLFDIFVQRDLDFVLNGHVSFFMFIALQTLNLQT